MRTYLIILLICGLGCFLIGCKKANSVVEHADEAPGAHADEAHDAHEESVVHLEEDQQHRVGVVLSKAEAASGTEMARYPGRLVSTSDGAAVVGPFVAGRITDLPVHLGTQVRSGQILCRIQSAEGADKVSACLRAGANRRVLLNEVNRLESLHREKIGSVRDLEVKKAELESAEAEYQAIRHAVRALGIDPDASTRQDDGFAITAPLSGSLVKMDAILGQYVSPGTDLFRIVNPSRVQVQTDVFEKDAVKLRPGAKALVRLPNLNLKLEAKVRAIGRELDSEKRTLPVLLDLVGGDEKALPGMLTEVFIETGQAALDLIKVPDQALILTESGYRIFVQENETTFEPREIEVVSLTGHEALVRGALKAGETIAAQGGFFLQSQSMKSTIVDACAH